jgi:hypothetical protein
MTLELSTAQQDRPAQKGCLSFHPFLDDRERNNVFVEHLWRTIKYEEVYLHAYDGVPEARAGDRPLSELLQRSQTSFGP